MIRALTLASALMAASLSANTLAAQSSSSSSPNPAVHQAPAVHVKTDTTAKMGNRTSAAPAHHAVWTPAQVKQAQEGLAKAGLYKGKATGVFNKETKRALRAYQKRNNLPVTGRLSDSVLVKLKSA
jgi:peptidoglycan hydrolase-like protein with peptidoglycan-binding domain